MYFQEKGNWKSFSSCRYPHEGRRVEPGLCWKVLDRKVPCHVTFHSLPFDCVLTWHICGTEVKGGRDGRIAWFNESILAQLYRPDIDMAYMINMDQTAVYYSMHLNKSLEARGMHTVQVISSKDECKICRVDLTFTESELQLLPLINCFSNFWQLSLSHDGFSHLHDSRFWCAGRGQSWSVHQSVSTHLCWVQKAIQKQY